MMEEIRTKFDKIKLRDTAIFSKTIDEKDINLFAKSTGATNPVHSDEEYAGHSYFGRKIVHGMLTAGLVSAVIGTKLPGPGSVYLSQILSFKKPVFINDELSAYVKVREIKHKKKIIILDT